VFFLFRKDEKGIYPLSKNGKHIGGNIIDKEEEVKKVDKKTYSIPIGPVHPSLEEPMTFNFEIYGERIQKVNLAPGDNHRGIEFMGRQRNPIQIIYLAERICGICSASHPFAFVKQWRMLLALKFPKEANIFE